MKKAPTLSPPKTPALKTTSGRSNGHSRIKTKVATEDVAEEPDRGTTTAKQKKAVGVKLVPIKKQTWQFGIAGETPLIVHQFNVKERQRMLDKQMGKVVEKEAKDPVQCFKDSLYRLPENRGFGIPARAFKAAAVTVSNDVGLVKTQMKRAIRVLGPDLNPFDVDALIPIVAAPIVEPITAEDKEYREHITFEHQHGASMRQDVVRLEYGVADIRFRGWFPRWSCTLNVTFNSRLISLEQLLALFEAAGFGSGVMEWRPSAPHSDSGQYGSFAINTTIRAKEIVKVGFSAVLP
jgi:hypothetical protein